MRKRGLHRGRTIAAAGTLMILAGGGAVEAAEGRVHDVRVVNRADGLTLSIDGADTMVFGMNWDYVPIGENYAYSLWNQPDEVIEAALAREMPLLQEMGVNAIRQYVGIPPRWVRHIYETYGIFTVLNHTVARYGYTLDGVWIPSVDYSDPRLRKAVTAEVLELVDEFADTPGVLMWLLGNENNYGLTWSSFEIEALPEGERDAARARHLYSLFDEITREIQARDSHRPVAIANGDLQYIDIIAEECRTLDVLGTNVYRGISARDLYEVVDRKLGVPVLFTEFGSDAFNAREMREDQVMQARYLIGQWQEIYEQSAGKGRVGNCIGGLIFQWSDGWWKFQQETRLDIHDTNASWPNGGYSDYVEGENNMNEEWWGITAKGPPDHRTLYFVYPRAAYYALKDAFELDPYAPTTTLEVIRSHFAEIRPAAAELAARGNRAALVGEAGERVRVTNLRIELETYSTGGDRTTTPESEVTGGGQPAFQGFDQMQSVYATVEAKPAENVVGSVSLNVLGDVPENRIDEIFYENRGRSRTITTTDGDVDIGALERVKIYEASIGWEDRYFDLQGFYRSGHYHWGYEGDFFGLYREAFYGENLDIYNGEAPIGVELTGRRDLSGITVAAGPELWWGANPSVMARLNRRFGSVDATLVLHEDLGAKSGVTTSFAVPQPETRKAALSLATTRGGLGIEVGGLWAGDPLVDRTFQLLENDDPSGPVLQDAIEAGDTVGGKVKLTYERGRWHWYAQGAYMGLVAEAGPTATTTYTGWTLKDSGSGNQRNVLTGVAVNLGAWQVAPNVLWQEPIVGPIPGDVVSPGRPRNILDDPFAVRANRETFGAELLLTYDPTPATWMWQWDSITREDARFAGSLGFVFKHHPTTLDAAIGIDEDGSTFAFGGGTPPRDLWELRGRVVSRLGPTTRIVANAYGGTAEPNGDDPRLVERFGLDGRLAVGRVAVAGHVKVNDFGPYDYHRDGNNTFPLQLMADLSHTLGPPRWFGYAQTRIGVRGTWRSLDEHSPRYSPDLIPGPGGTSIEDPDSPNGNEWEIRTYLHLAM